MSAQHMPEMPPVELFLANLKTMDLSLFGMTESDRPKVEQHIIRIVACVNELAGKPEGWVAQIENAYNHAAHELQKAKQQRDNLQFCLDKEVKRVMSLTQQRNELLAALRTISRDSDKYSAWWAANLAYEAIAKAQEVV